MSKLADNIAQQSNAVAARQDTPVYNMYRQHYKYSTTTTHSALSECGEDKYSKHEIWKDLSVARRDDLAN